MKVRDIIKSTLRIIGAISSGENPTADESNDALQSLNSMLGLWSINGLLVYEIKRETFDLVAGQQVYTFGLTGNFNSVRPNQILDANSLENGIETPLEILNHQQWAGISSKNVSSSVPSKLYLEKSYPLAKINLWPIPNVTNQIVIQSLKNLPAFTSINDDVILPDGYEEALKYNLALRLAPEYGKALDPSIERIAIEAKMELQRNSSRELLLTTELTALAPDNYNIIYAGRT